MLRAESLEVRIADRILVQELNLVVNPGELWGVLGRNGAGKSTLLHVLAGLRPPEAGRVLLDGDPVERISRRRVARYLGLLLQEETRDYWGSAREYALLGRYPHVRGIFGPDATDHEIVDRALATMDLRELAAHTYRSLSGGERQRARLAALFAQQPACYMCDEPLQQLDLPHQVATLDWVRQESQQRRAASLIVLHDLVFASRYCDHLLLLFGDGRYLSGKCEEMLTEENLHSLYGYAVEAHEISGETVFLPATSSSDAQL